MYDSKHIINTDPLTGGANEEYLIKIYNGIIDSEQKKYAFISLKLKKFRNINYILGRAVGDEFLKQIYAILRDYLKDDEYIARIYADYFNLLIRFQSENDLTKRILEINSSIRCLKDKRFFELAYAGLGVYILPAISVDFYSAQYCADLSRVESMHNHYVNSHYEIYNVTFQNQSERYAEYERHMEAALEQGAFKLYLQPKVELNSGEIFKAEALVRWENSDNIIHSPASFIPCFENNGFIRNIDLYLFNQVCRFISKWLHEEGKEICISVNLSKAYFEDDFFLADYAEVFERYHIPKHCIQIELLESIVMNETTRLKKVVNEIYDYGFSCALDDFGSGFSSFNILTSIPLSELKIDRSLFQDEHNAKEKSLIKHIIEVAKDFDMKIVAEGIESQGYVDYLSQIGCDYIQGYIFYKPMSVEEFENRFIVENEKAYKST